MFVEGEADFCPLDKLNHDICIQILMTILITTFTAAIKRLLLLIDYKSESIKSFRFQLRILTPGGSFPPHI